MTRICQNRDFLYSIFCYQKRMPAFGRQGLNFSSETGKILLVSNAGFQISERNIAVQVQFMKKGCLARLPRTKQQNAFASLMRFFDFLL